MKEYRLEGETVVIRVSDGASFTVGTTGNRDWEEYSQWLSKGNTPDPYVEPEVPYQDKRIQAYGSIGDQLDMKYRDLVNDTTEWKDHIADVKAKYPKP